ncbi:MAG: sugar phosphate isomerase/epimerase [Planctomycetes bacterium]|nr:sugar phosphate isomerase/epimerase [Planctomycetota bacterium]
MFHSGIADEAGGALDIQIKAHKELGWTHIELRNVDGTQFTDVTDEKFEEVCQKLADADLKVSCFASGIANWACKISDPFEKSVDTLKRAIPRMQKLNTPFIRVMSYPNDNLDDNAWRDESVRRMKELGKMAEDGGVILAVENCDGWASATADNYAAYFELVNSPAVKAVYDTGNPASHGQTNTWEWYTKCKPHIAYVHIKCHEGPKADGTLGAHQWPEVGISKVKETLEDIFKSGYDGGISIEPHLKSVIHEGKSISDEDAAYMTYVEYGKRVTKMVADARAKA